MRHIRRLIIPLLPLAITAVSGCASATKARYLRHVEAAVAPGAAASPEVAVAFGLGSDAQPDEALVQVDAHE
jgi:hypothetical protein